MSELHSRFSPLPWMQSVFASLVAQAKEDRFPHALMLEGTEGSGKLHLARALAAYLLCENRATQDSACGDCKHCELMLSESHGDYREIMPEEAGKQIKVSAIRELSEFVSGSSLLGGVKVVVLAPVSAMNISASNALLKTLEEPSGNTVLILVSHAGGQVMPTIRSRCQTVKPPAAESAMVLTWLGQQFDLDAAAFDRLKALAPGAPLRMRDYLESNMLSEIDAMLALLSGMLKRELTVTEVSEVWAGDQPVQRMLWLSQWLKEITEVAITEDEAFVIHPAARKMFVYLSSRHSALVLSNLYQESVRALGHLRASNNLNPVLIFEQLLGRWLALMSSTPSAK